MKSCPTVAAPVTASDANVSPPDAVDAKIDAAAPGFDDDASATAFAPTDNPSPLTPTANAPEPNVSPSPAMPDSAVHAGANGDAPVTGT